jgi:hypothetical protein
MIYYDFKTYMSWVWWHRPINPVLRRLRQNEHEFKASLGYQAIS